MTEIKLSNISKSYGKIKAINNLDFLFKEGKFYVIIGPSGCGKSTLLKIISHMNKSIT